MMPAMLAAASPAIVSRLGLSLLLAMAPCVLAQESAQDPKPALSDGQTERPSDFARFVADKDGGHFDVAVTTYENQDGVRVVLFGAVHIADARHYEELQRRFTGVERLLYELVGPDDYRPRKGEARAGFVSMLQQGMKNGLELEFQLDGVDYGAENFVHADMTPEEFASSMEQRGESLLMMMFNLGMNAQKSLQEQQDEAADEPAGAPAEKPVDLVSAFRSGEGRHQLRLMMAQQLEAMESLAAGGEGSTLLEGRNEKCLSVLQQQIQQGRKLLGIYYGAAHLPHMERRLCDDLGFAKVGHEWLVAWDCTKRPDPKVDRDLWRARRQAKVDVAGIAKAAKAWIAEQHGDGRAPGFAELVAAKGAAHWAGKADDPWGQAYRIRVVGGDVDVHSLGQDGQPDTDDDIHSASPRELRAMARREQQAGR